VVWRKAVSDARLMPSLSNTAMPTVLVVDDETMVRELAARMLREAGYDVVQAADGRLAWALMHEPTTAVDLVLSDVVMPGYTGTELVALVLEHRPQLPIVLMSGYSPTTLSARGLNGAPVPLLVKPFKEADLVEIVARSLRGHPQRDGAPTT
jgi:CheY-like chemotaxis protein